MAQRNNPPWQKTQMNLQQQQQMSLQQQMGLQSQLVGFQHNQIFAQQQQQQQIPLLQLQNQLLQQSAQVQYPTRTSLNSIAFQQQQQQPTQQQTNNQNTSVLQQHQQSSKFNSQQRVFSGTGVVSKVQNDIGFIDDEVLFHKNVCVKGLSPKTGDRVLVEAAYNQAMPFKWNATRVQVLPSQSSSNSRASANSPNSNNLPSKSSYNSVPPPGRDTSNNSNEMYRSRRNYSPAAPRKSPERRPRSRDRREAEMQEAERKRRRDEREKERNTTRKDTIEKKERSPIRKQSPKFRRARVVPRYMVLIPKITLTL